jgi:hypothetical protein
MLAGLNFVMIETRGDSGGVSGTAAEIAYFARVKDRGSAVDRKHRGLKPSVYVIERKEGECI